MAVFMAISRLNWHKPESKEDYFYGHPEIWKAAAAKTRLLRFSDEARFTISSADDDTLW